MTQKYIEKILTARVYDVAMESPLDEAKRLSERLDNRILLKREDLSPVRSYKIRGAYNFLRKSLKKKPGTANFVCASAGNHSQGFAFACDHFKVNGTIFMPVTTPKQKIEKTRVS